MERRITIDEIRIAKGISWEDLILHWEAHNFLSRTDNDIKVKKIPEELRQRIRQFYKKLQEINLYPKKIENGEITFQEKVLYQEAWYRLLKSHPQEYPYISRADVKKVLEINKMQNNT